MKNAFLFSFAVIALGSSGMALAKTELPCRTDGCSMRRQSEMESAMEFANQTASVVSYVTSIQRVGDGMFKLVNADKQVFFVKASVPNGEIEARVESCYNSKWVKIECDSLRP